MTRRSRFVPLMVVVAVAVATLVPGWVSARELFEIRLGANLEGEGKAAMATKISFDRKKNNMELENYGSEPVRLQTVKVER